MTKDQQGNITVAACVALSTVLGSIHAFSVFVPEWEQMADASRARVSLTYSIALVFLTITVLLGHRIYRLFSPSMVILISGSTAATGLALSASGSSLALLYVTYGVVFGGANGLGYGYALQLSGQARPTRRGMAMGLVTAFYAVGATIAPLLFLALMEHGGNSRALTGMAMVVLSVSLVAAMLVRYSRARYESETMSEIRTLSPLLLRVRRLLWLGYGTGVAAGLMIIGHAYGIALWLQSDSDLAAWAPTIVALGNMLGGFSAGYYADRLSGGALLRWLPVLSAAGLLLLFKPLGEAWLLAAVGLGFVGYSYGAIIAVFPVAVSDLFGALAAPRIYGQVFTAWGLAGLLGPWVSGLLYDRTASYSVAVSIAVVLSGVAAIAIRVCIPDD